MTAKASRRALLVLAALLTLWSPYGASAAEKVALQLIWDHQFQFAGFYAAQWKGYYAQEGLEVEIRPGVAPNRKLVDAMEELVSGRADFAIAGANVLVERERGAPLSVLAVIFQKSPVAFFYKDALGRLQPSDLVRLRVARRLGGVTDVEFQSMLRVEGIDPARVKALSPRPGLANLAAGDVDVAPGYTIASPLIARQLGLKVRSLRPSSYGVDFYGDTLITHRRVIDRDPKVVERFVRASLRGWEYALSHSDEIARRIALRLPRTIALDDPLAFNLFQAEEVKKVMLYPLVGPGHVNPHRWRRMHAFMKKAGVVTGALDTEALIHDPVRHALERDRFLHRTLIAAGIFAVLAVIGLFLFTRTLKHTVARRTAALRNSEATLANAERIAHLGSYAWNTETGTLHWSDETYRIFGYEPGEVEPTFDFFLRHIHEDDRAMFENALATARAGDHRHQTDFRIVRRDGEERVVRDRGEIGFDDRGGRTLVCGAVRDVTEQHRAEEALSISEQRFRDIAEIASDWIWELDSELRFTLLSEGANRSLGPVNESYIGKYIEDLGPPDGESHEWQRHLDDLKAHRPFRDFAARRKSADGSERHLLISANPMVAADGAFLGYRGATRDVTAQMDAERKAEALEKRFLDAIDHLSEQVALYDSDERLVFFNQGFVRSMGTAAELIAPGMTLEEILRTRFRHHQTPEQAKGRVDEWIAERLRRFRNPSAPWQFERGGEWYETREARQPDGSTVVMVTNITELKKREKEAHENEERYRTLMEMTPEPVFVQCDGRVVFANPAAASILGAESPDRLIGEKSIDFFHPDSHASIEERRAMTRETGQTQPFKEHRYVRFDGGEIDVETSIAPFVWHGSPAILVVVRDISDRKRAEEVLRQSELHHRLLVEASPDPIFVDCEGTIVFANRAAVEAFGAESAAHLVGSDALDLIHPDDRASVQVRRRALSSQGEINPVTERRCQRLDGSMFFAEARAAQFVWDGAPAWLLTFHDITDRKQAEEALRDSEAKLRSTVDNSPFVIALKDIDGRFVMVNREYCANLDARPEDVIGKTVGDILPAEFAAPLIAQEQKVLAGLAPVEEEWLCPTVAGIRRQSVAMFPILDDEGYAVGIGTIAADITERRQIEERLAQAQKMEAVGHLTGGMAHEFNNLLQAMLGYLELVRDGLGDIGEGRDEDDQLDRFVAGATRACLKAADITRNLLAFARKQPLRPQAIALSEVVSEMNDLVRGVLTESIVFRCVLNGNLWPAVADASQVQSALINIVLNARDAMPEGGALTIEVANASIDEAAASGFGEDASAGDYVLLSVADTGAGIPPEVLDSVFEPFYTTKDVGKGTGLGLSMVYGFATQSNGFVTISSVVGRGTRVDLYLPKANDDDTGKNHGPEMRAVG